MKKLTLLALALIISSAQAAQLFCSVDNRFEACVDLYDVFMAEETCFKGDVGEVSQFSTLGLAETNGIRFLEGQDTDSNRMLLFVEETGVEQMRYITRCL